MTPTIRSPYTSGGSTVVSLPPDLMDEAGIDQETDLLVETDGKTLTLSPVEFHKAHRATGGDE